MNDDLKTETSEMKEAKYKARCFKNATQQD
jgi:hypothetical protein